MSEYTPTRQELIAAWIIAHQEEGWGGQVDMGGSPKERIAEAHRGIAEVERAAAEKAWDEGYNEWALAPAGDQPARDNPYRREEA